ncbi:uncharacterized mitochondrial protein AtMg00810-like [Brassica napus]|uniref:uncharacterized mitochondrial protein AtMg00810-like n=1 Tax=Brassica napus TaxID=3708 RepID=UPI00207904B7|nr:uncharacterized mitochondrial protein AtMg00810-like [Brassica napus]
MIEKNKTWKLVDKPKKKNVISVKWIYKIKTDANDNHIKHKAASCKRVLSRQAPREWYGRIDSYFLQNSFKRSMNDAALYIMKQGGDVLIVSLYVNDIIITGSNIQSINTFKENMKKEFEMVDLGLLNYFLGMEVIQDDGGIFLSQEKYANKLADKFGERDRKSVSNPLTPQGKGVEDDKEYGDPTKYRNIVGGLLYMSSPRMKHYQEAKRVLRYVKGTSNFGVYFTSVKEPRLVGYTDSDWGGSKEARKALQQISIAIEKNLVQHRRTKHIEIKYHFVREAEQKEIIELKYHWTVQGLKIKEAAWSQVEI